MSEFTKKGKPTFESDNAREGDGMGKGDVDALGGQQGTRSLGGCREEHGEKDSEGGWSSWRVVPLCQVASSRHPEVASGHEQWSYARLG